MKYGNSRGPWFSVFVEGSIADLPPQIPDFCRWKYADNPLGDAAVAIALGENRVIGVVAATPKLIKLENEVVRAYELGDFITEANFRNRGLFSNLVNLVCDAVRERGAALVYVRPNEASFPILASRLGFNEPNKMDTRRYPLPSAALQRKLGVPAVIPRALGADWVMRECTLRNRPTSVIVERVERFDAGFDDLWVRLQHCYRFSLVRDSNYLNWRYIDCPTRYFVRKARRANALVGYIVTYASTTKRVGTVVDLFTHAQDDDAAFALLHSAMEDLERDRIQVIYTWTLQQGANSASHHILRRVCFLVEKPPLHFAIKFLNDASSRELPSTNWQLTVGDFDGI